MALKTIYFFVTLALVSGPGTQDNPNNRELSDLQRLNHVRLTEPKLVATDQRVQLGGQIDRELEGGDFKFIWVQLHGPQRVSLRNNQSIFAWFDPSAQGRYVFLLAVRDERGQTRSYATVVNVIDPDRIAEDQVRLTVRVEGEGYVTPGNGIYGRGQEVTMRAVSDRIHWTFDRWQNVPEEDAEENPIRLTADRPKTIAAVFVEEEAGPEALAILPLVNEIRREAGLDELQWNDQLSRAADRHVRDMIERDYFSHVAPDGTTLRDRVEEEEYPWRRIGENIAFGQRDAQEAMDHWMESPGHRENILNPDFTEMGAAYREGPQGRPFWVQVFGTPRR